MPESLDALLSRTVNPFTPLRVGDLTVGWVAPHTEGNADGYSNWYVAVGDTVFDLSYSWFLSRCNQLSLEFARETRRVTHFEADFIMTLPAGSIDLLDEFRMNYTERTMQHLHAAFTDYVRVFKNDVQSQLNNKDLHEAATMYRNLKAYNYPYSEALSWRGQLAEGMLCQSVLELVEEVMANSNK